MYNPDWVHLLIVTLLSHIKIINMYFNIRIDFIYVGLVIITQLSQVNLI